MPYRTQGKQVTIDKPIDVAKQLRITTQEIVAKKKEKERIREIKVENKALAYRAKHKDKFTKNFESKVWPKTIKYLQKYIKRYGRRYIDLSSLAQTMGPKCKRHAEIMLEKKLKETGFEVNENGTVYWR